jgi:hypothetical protein
MGSEGRDRGLPVPLRHIYVTGGVIGEVRIVVAVPPAKCEGCELGASHVRLQLLQWKGSIATCHLSLLRELS